ncbi:hypothetical protein [Kitasatospora sp. NPDC059673]|uniref:hypothetical protein n=1 Tax=Kitasatospora sp. NPDC059673 TaxID=3346901 RepID=UPI00369212BC
MAAALTFGGPVRRPRARLLHVLLLALAAALALLVHHSVSAEASPAMSGMPGMVHGTTMSAGVPVPDAQLAHAPAGQSCAAGTHCVGTDVRGPVLTAPAAHPAPVVAAVADTGSGGPHGGRHSAGPSPPDSSLLSVLRI